MNFLSFKLIELQVAIPRTMDAAKSSIEISNRGVLQQEYKTEEIRKQHLIETKSVTRKQQTDKSYIHTNIQDEKTAKDAKHPFKGKKIDYSG